MVTLQRCLKICTQAVVLNHKQKGYDGCSHCCLGRKISRSCIATDEGEKEGISIACHAGLSLPVQRATTLCLCTG